QQRSAFFQRVNDEVHALPGVLNVGYGSTLPFLSAGNTRWFSIEGVTKDGDQTDTLFRVATPGYLSALGVRAIEGRLLEDRDVGTDAPGVVINETMAKRYWGGASPIGGRMRIANPRGPVFTVVGVVNDVHERGYTLAMKPGVYVPFVDVNQDTPDSLVVR